jgi:hypothetical protein
LIAVQERMLGSGPEHDDAERADLIEGVAALSRDVANRLQLRRAAL